MNILKRLQTIEQQRHGSRCSSCGRSDSDTPVFKIIENSAALVGPDRCPECGSLFRFTITFDRGDGYEL